ncbi:MAG: ribonuclease III [Desulfarculus sp.]|nr:MAG: ribonuclease III [Desulfarculus sp.]
MEDERRQRLEQLCQHIGHEFKDISLLHQALCHASYVHEHSQEALSSYERLEYLGDAVLELVISELLFSAFPEASEGELSKARALVVNENRLAATAGGLGLGQCLLLGRGEESQGGRDKPSLLADALEALVAAVYLDAGLEAARDVVQRLLGEAAQRALGRKPRKDCKTSLQELVQEALHVTPRYELVEAIGPDHAKTFTVNLLIGERRLAAGSGRSKKEAEQEAARLGLERWASGDTGIGPD